MTYIDGDQCDVDEDEHDVGHDDEGDQNVGHDDEDDQNVGHDDVDEYDVGHVDEDYQNVGHDEGEDDHKHDHDNQVTCEPASDHRLVELVLEVAFGFYHLFCSGILLWIMFCIFMYICNQVIFFAKR